MTMGELRDFPNGEKEGMAACEDYVAKVREKIVETFGEQRCTAGGFTFTSTIVDTRDEKFIKVYNSNLGDGTLNIISENEEGVIESELINELDRPDHPEEQKRLQTLGASVEDGRLMLGEYSLSVSAGLADDYFKKGGKCFIRRTPKVHYKVLPKEQEVKSLPQVTSSQNIRKRRRLGLLACDGVHEHPYLLISEVQKKINQIIQENITKPVGEISELIREFCLKHSFDNFTFFLFDFDEIPSGKVIEFTLCDGHGELGYEIAQTACDHRESQYDHLKKQQELCLGLASIAGKLEESQEPLLKKANLEKEALEKAVSETKEGVIPKKELNSFEDAVSNLWEREENKTELVELRKVLAETEIKSEKYQSLLGAADLKRHPEKKSENDQKLTTLDELLSENTPGTDKNSSKLEQKTLSSSTVVSDQPHTSLLVNAKKRQHELEEILKNPQEIGSREVNNFKNALLAIDLTNRFSTIPKLFQSNRSSGHRDSLLWEGRRAERLLLEKNSTESEESKSLFNSRTKNFEQTVLDLENRAKCISVFDQKYEKLKTQFVMFSSAECKNKQNFLRYSTDCLTKLTAEIEKYKQEYYTRSNPKICWDLENSIERIVRRLNAVFTLYHGENDKKKIELMKNELEEYRSMRTKRGGEYIHWYGRIFGHSKSFKFKTIEKIEGNLDKISKKIQRKIQRKIPWNHWMTKN